MNDFDPSAISLDEWSGIAEASTKGGSIDSLSRQTEDGLTIKALYSAVDLPDTLPLMGRPGWTIAQEIEPPKDAAGLNRMLLDEFAGGAGRVDLPAGMDPSLLPDALDGIELETASFGFAPGGDWLKAAEALAASKQGGKACLGADPALRLLNGEDGEADAVADWMKKADAVPANATVIAVAGDEYHLMGLAPAEELAVVLAATAHSLRRLEAGGIAPGAALGRMEWRFAGEADLYGSIAKTRALALALKRMADAVGGGSDGIETRMHGVTSARHLSRLDMETNILRNGTALLGMALGGAGTITVRPHDWLTGASPEALRLARNAHHLMASEARLASVEDPASGSYFIESLTGDMARHAWGLFQRIEAAGGIPKSVGLIRDWAGSAAEARQALVNEDGENLLGVTMHPAREADSGLDPVVEGVFGPRGGERRPAAAWEELRMAVNGKSLRCLLLDRGEGATAEACQRWFQAAGVEAVAMRCADEAEAMKALASAQPEVLVLGGVDDAAPYAEAVGAKCCVLDASAFTGDRLMLMRDILGVGS